MFLGIVETVRSCGGM